MARSSSRLGPKVGPERILIVTPSGRDAEVAAMTLRDAGLTAVAFPNIESLCTELSDMTQKRVDTVLMAEEALTEGAYQSFVAILKQQPTWSDLPVILLASHSHGQPEARLSKLVPQLGNVSLLERPMRKVTLTTAVQVAVRQRRRQISMAELLDKQRRDVERRDHFLAMLGHELRNPLSAIVLASETHQDDDPETTRQYREVVSRQATNLKRIVDDILDVARATRDKLRIERASLDLRAVARRAADANRAAFEGKGIDFDLSLEQRPVPVLGDAVRLEQVIQNLLANALRFTKPGGRVELLVEQRGEESVLSVSDTGEGIPKERLDQIFELFEQVDEGVRRHRGGLGLGLPLIDRIVQLHDGSVTAHSEGPGKGSTFTIWLPLHPAGLDELVADEQLAEEPSAEPTAEAPSPAGKREAVARPLPEGEPPPKVLLVEDDDDNREMLLLLLRRRGLDVHAAANGTEAIRLLEEISPRIAVIDIGLPDIDGYEVGRRARQRFGDKIRLFALTGYGHAEAKRKTREAGFDAHLTKPLDPRRLQAILAR